MLQKIASCFTGKISRWVTLVVWVLVAVLLTISLPSANDKIQNNAENLPQDAQSIIAGQLLSEYFPNASGVPALLVYERAGGLTEDDYTALQGLTEQLMESPLPAQEGIIPLHLIPVQALSSIISDDGSTIIVPISFTAETETSILKENLITIKQTLNELAQTDLFNAELESAGALARFTGPVGISVDATELFLDADIELLIATVLLVLILLLVIYRSPLLAIIPLVGVGFAFMVTSPILGWMADQGWIALDSQTVSIMTVLLFGAGTDYCLFLIARYRDELQEDSSVIGALIKAFKGASGAIAMSGFTVVIALLALLFAQYGSSHRFAIPFSLSIFIMGIASLTLVPAILAILGRKSFFPFIPRTEEMAKEHAAKHNKTYKPKVKHKTWTKIGDFVTNKPWLVIITTMVVLVGLAIASTGAKYNYDILSSFPEDLESREGFEIIGDKFTQGELAPITVITTNDSADMRKALLADERVHHVAKPTISEIDEAYSSFDIVLHIDPYSNEAMDYIEVLDNELMQAAGEGNYWIAGQTSEQFDARVITERDNMVIMPIVILLIVLLLLIYLRSIVATFYLVVTVLISFAAALGLGWLILHHLMGFDAISASIPLYSFVFLIALGEDYNIFMISGIWKRAKVMPLKQAIKEGVGQSGEVISSAGLILAGTFFVLCQMPLTLLLQFGAITGLGVLLDTFVVRPFLVPALTTVLGKWAFWPSKLKMDEAKLTSSEK